MQVICLLEHIIYICVVFNTLHTSGLHKSLSYFERVYFFNFKLTLPKLPFPRTIRKLKSEARMTSFLPMLWGTSLSAVTGAFLVIEVF